MVMNDKEKAELRKEQKALLYCRATLVVRCFFAWSDFRRAIVAVKKAKLRHLQMVQRVCLHAMAEEATFVREALAGARLHHKGATLKIFIKAWRTVVDQCLIVFPRMALYRYRGRQFFDELRTMKREKIFHQALVPYQHRRRAQKIFSSWKRFYVVKLRFSTACDKVEHVKAMYLKRLIMATWPGRASFRKAEQMKKYNDERGRAVSQLVGVTTGKDKRILMEEARIEKENLHRSFIQIRKEAPIQRRAALFGIIYSENDAESVFKLFNMLRAVLFAWSDQAHIDATLRGMERLVMFRHQRWLLQHHMRTWIGRSASTSHRLALWVTRKFEQTHHKNIDVDMRSIATQYLVDSYAELDSRHTVENRRVQHQVQDMIATKPVQKKEKKREMQVRFDYS